MPGGLTLGTEVQKRLGGRYAVADIVAYLNRGLSLVTSSCPMVFDEIELDNVAVTNSVYTTPVDLDATRKVVFSHHVNSVPIPKLNTLDASQLGSNSFTPSSYKNTGAAVFFNGWTWNYLTGAAQPQARFYPYINGGAPGTVDIKYHKLPPTLVAGSDTPSTFWGNQWLDDLVIDYAEAEIKRIINYVGWQDLQARFQSKIVELRMMGSNEREDTGDVQENQTVEQSKQALGRN